MHFARADEATAEAHSGSPLLRRSVENSKNEVALVSGPGRPGNGGPVSDLLPPPRVPPRRDRAPSVHDLSPAAALPPSESRPSWRNDRRRQYTSVSSTYSVCARMTACMAEIGSRIMTPCELENGVTSRRSFCLVSRRAQSGPCTLAFLAHDGAGPGLLPGTDLWAAWARRSSRSEWWTSAARRTSSSRSRTLRGRGFGIGRRWHATPAAIERAPDRLPAVRVRDALPEGLSAGLDDTSP